MRFRFLPLLLLAVSAAAQLPTGKTLDPVAPSHAVGNFPTAAVLSPEGDRVVVLLCGYRQPGEGIQVVDRATGNVEQTLPLNAAFLGIVFAPDGKTLYASGGNDDVVHVFRWSDRRATADGAIALAPPKRDPKQPGRVYPAGLALSPDGKHLYVVENLGDGLDVIDTATRRIVQRMQTERYPYGVAVAPNGDVYVSCWGDRTLDVFRPSKGFLTRRARIDVGRHPSAMAIHGKRLFAACATTDTIAVVDTTTNKVVKTLSDAAPGGPREGSTPNALAVAHDRLFVAEADNNAVAVFDVKTDALLGRVPVEWYPSAVVAAGSDVVVVNAKGRGAGPNPNGPQPNRRIPPDSSDYTLGQLNGTLLSFSATLPRAELSSLSTRVAKANGWKGREGTAKYPPFKHVVYVIKENRTYDQVLGDVKGGDGDASLQFFGADAAPNHRALAARFGLFDRFFVNAEVSAQGHNWSTAAYTSDYTEKAVPPQYGRRGRTYDYEGTNRDEVVDDDDDVASPSTGYLWDLAVRKGISLRNYGEFVAPDDDVYVGTRRALAATSVPDFPGFDMKIPDQKRADIWIRELNDFVKRGSMPALEIVRLPNDHTNGTTPEMPTPRAYMADNDLALGRMIEALSTTPFWRDTAVFVLEDDAQAGPDHVDSHRSLLYVISAYNRPGTIHRFVNTTDVIATMEEILGLGSLSQFDHYGRPLRGIFASQPDLTEYKALRPSVDLGEKNPKPVAAPAPAPEHAQLDFSRADAIDDDVFNRILWKAIKGDVPYPEVKRYANPLGR
ncbi:MAG TPA: alkaline phosphatase family protein [Thermoanaerobaculia bacterium]|nr:alkaline phosphatase family protein [Thermoanaerobaculia bacterium]